jgi:DNA-binding NtrC family response regulator
MMGGVIGTHETPTRKPAVLLADDDEDFVLLVSRSLGDIFDLRAVLDGRSALSEFESRAYDAVLLDVNLIREPDGLEVLRRMRLIDSQVPIFMVTGSERPEEALRAGRLGASEYFAKGSSMEVLLHRIRSALESRMAERRQEALERRASQRHPNFVGDSGVIRRLVTEAETVARVDTAVMITGESGTGQEALARFVHRMSPRAEKPFVVVNCAAIPEELVESELFGRERGTPTDATGARRGSFELADGGTLLLDEVTEMPLALQPRLLRALQTGEFSHAGSERVQTANVRVICTSHRNLAEAVSEGRLREDLLYAINVISLHIPPLRDRWEDIPVLARHFLRAKAKELGKHIEGFTPEAEALLLAHDWPGNSRELENLIERAVVFCNAARIEPDQLSPISAGAAFLSLPWEEARELIVRRFERSYLAALLQVHGGSVSRASKAMGVSRQAFYKALERTRLNPEEFRRRRQQTR